MLGHSGDLASMSSWLEWIVLRIRTVTGFHGRTKILDKLNITFCGEIRFNFSGWTFHLTKPGALSGGQFPQGGAHSVQLNRSNRRGELGTISREILCCYLMRAQSSRLQQWPQRRALSHIMLLIEHARSLGGYAGCALVLMLREAQGVLMENSKTSVVLEGVCVCTLVYTYRYMGVVAGAQIYCFCLLWLFTSPAWPLPRHSNALVAMQYKNKAMIPPVTILLSCSALWPRVM